MAFDRMATDQPIPVGTLVYVRNHPAGRNKIQDAFKDQVYRVVSRHGQHNVYTVESADGFGLPRTVGRAELCPSSSEDGVIAVVDAGSATTLSVSLLVSPVTISSGTSDEEKVVPRRSGRRTAGYNSNIHREPRSCRYPRVGHCSKCNVRVRVDDSVVW